MSSPLARVVVADNDVFEVPVPVSPMPNSSSGSAIAALVKDLPASIVVFLVALPLSLGIAVASGATPQAGLIAATIGGVVVGLIGGAPLQVSGPAAGLTVMVFGYVQRFGLPSLGIVVLIAGTIQIMGGLLRIARAAMAISPAVMHAMLAGIGVLITLGQVRVLLGAKPASDAIENLATMPDVLANASLAPMLIGGATHPDISVVLGPDRLSSSFADLAVTMPGRE